MPDEKGDFDTVNHVKKLTQIITSKRISLSPKESKSSVQFTPTSNLRLFAPPTPGILRGPQTVTPPPTC